MFRRKGTESRTDEMYWEGAVQKKSLGKTKHGIKDDQKAIL